VFLYAKNSARQIQFHSLPKKVHQPRVAHILRGLTVGPASEVIVQPIYNQFFLAALILNPIFIRIEFWLAQYCEVLFCSFILILHTFFTILELGLYPPLGSWHFCDGPTDDHPSCEKPRLLSNADKMKSYLKN
jgi:hypothetical protein